MENTKRKQWRELKEEKLFAAAALISVRNTRGRTLIITQAFGWTDAAPGPRGPAVGPIVMRWAASFVTLERILRLTFV
jgi:hypothetical protein